MNSRFILLLSALAAVSSCSKVITYSAPEGGEVPALESLIIRADDNPWLPDGYTVTPDADGSLAVRFPYSVSEEDLDSVVIRFNLSRNAARLVTPDGTELRNGSSVDLSDSLHLTVSYRQKTSSYTVSASIAGAPVWSRVAESDVLVESDPVMKINPSDSLPYIMGQVSGASQSRWYPILLGLRGGALTAVADTLAKVRSNYFGLDFDPEGGAWVNWFDNVAGVQTLGKVSGGVYATVGTTVKSTCNVSTSAPVVAVASDKVWMGSMTYSARNGVCKQGLYAGFYDGVSLSSPVTICDRSLSQITYCAISKTVRGVPYLLCFDYPCSLSLYRYNTGTQAWENVFGGSLTLPRADGSSGVTSMEFSGRCIDFDVDRGGDVLLFAFCNWYDGDSKKYPAVCRYDTDTRKVSLIGSVISDDSRQVSKVKYASMAVDDAGVPYIAFANAGNSQAQPACLLYIDPGTKDWSAPVVLTESKTTGIDIKFDASGTGYVALLNSETKRYELYKSTK